MCLNLRFIRNKSVYLCSVKYTEKFSHYTILISLAVTFTNHWGRETWYLYRAMTFLEVVEVVV